MSTTAPTAAFVAQGRRLRIDAKRRWFPDMGALVRARQLIYLLSRRDITASYRQTLMGTVWIFIGPIVSAGLFTFVFGSVADLPSGGFPYFAYSYAALLGWNLFSNTLTNVSRSLSKNQALLTKIYFPRLAIPLSNLAAGLVNTAVSIGIMMAILAYFGIGLTFNVLLLPFWLLLALTLATGIGLVLTACAVLWRDVNYVTPMLTQLLLFLSPVAYATSEVPEDVRTLYLLNPMTTIVDGCRWSVLGETALTGWAIGYSAAFALVVLAIGMVAFARLESVFADVI